MLRNKCAFWEEQSQRAYWLYKTFVGNQEKRDVVLRDHL